MSSRRGGGASLSTTCAHSSDMSSRVFPDPPSPRGPPRRGRRRASRAQAREFSAGRRRRARRGEVVTIVPTRRAADGSRVLALPKGHVDPGETPIEAAVREVCEETGIVAEPVCELGESRYWYRRDGRTIGKSVAFFLFSYVEGDTADHDDEVEEVRWLDLRAALTELSYEGERGDDRACSRPAGGGLRARGRLTEGRSPARLKGRVPQEPQITVACRSCRCSTSTRRSSPTSSCVGARRRRSGSATSRASTARTRRCL